MLLLGLGFLQFQRIIEGKDLPIIAGVTMAMVVIIGPFNRVIGDESWIFIVVAALMAGGAVVIIAVIFRLVFRLLSEIM